MLADLIKIHCLAHGATFPMSRTSRTVVCKEGETPHILSENFPTEAPEQGGWIHCCNCQTFIAYDRARSSQLGDLIKECPFCLSSLNPRLYACDHCAVMMVDYDDQTLRKQHTILSWGMPQPACPGCHRFPRATPHTHACAALQSQLATARASCPFCGAEARPASSDSTQPFAQEITPSLVQELAAAKTQAAEAEARIHWAEEETRKELELRVQAERKAEEMEQRATSSLTDWTPLVAAAEQARVAAELERARAAAAAQARLEAEQKASAAEERRLAAESAMRQEADLRAAAERRISELDQQSIARAASSADGGRPSARGARAIKRDRVTFVLYGALAGVLFTMLILLIYTLLQMRA